MFFLKYFNNNNISILVIIKNVPIYINSNVTNGLSFLYN